MSNDPVYKSLMKRALPSYDDLVDGNAEEDGEIIEDCESENCILELSDHSEDEEYGLKAVLPVGKFNDKFKEGDQPASGEEYLCTVRSERLKMNRIIKAYVGEGECGGVGVKDLLCRNETAIKVVDAEEEWAEKYWKCYQESENQFITNINCDFDGNIVLSSHWSSTELYKKLYENGEIEPNMAVLNILRNDPELTEKLINCHRNWLESSVIQLSNELEREKVATWLQALLMCLDNRLTSPQISNLRQLAYCLDSTYPEFKEIVLVIARKYGQHDLIRINRQNK